MCDCNCGKAEKEERRLKKQRQRYGDVTVEILDNGCVKDTKTLMRGDTPTKGEAILMSLPNRTRRSLKQARRLRRRAYAVSRGVGQDRGVGQETVWTREQEAALLEAEALLRELARQAEHEAFHP